MKRTTERGKTLLRRSVLSFAVFLLFLSVAAPSLAWFARAIYRSVTGEFKASSILSYFGGGTGKKGDPYQIETPKHLYNLSWLQNKGVFTDKTYFELSNDINMAGSNSGTGNETGAIPPIGSKENPFTGVFNGNHHVISNLWVSTLKSDWKEQPEDAVDYSGTHVGMFGGISGGASVSNFNLDRVEVKSHISATVGIVCGYVDASISGVGVYNGILNLSGGKTFSSRYSLLGELTDNVSWSDMPKGEGGGDLVITPSDLKTVAAGSIEAVPNALPGTAYYVGSLTKTNVSGGNTVQMYDMRTGTAKVFTTPDANAPNKAAQQKVIDAFNAYNTKGGKQYLYAGGFPTIGEVTVGSVTKQMPKNSVWFKPTVAGVAALAFVKYNNSSNRYMAVYKYKRNENGTLEEISKTEFVLPTSLSNGSVVYYEYEVTDTDVKAGYEFAIGASKHDNEKKADSTTGFIAMALAGTDTASDKTLKVMDVDYITTVNQDVSAEGYTIHQTILEITSTTLSGDTLVYYKAIGANGSSKVNYYSTPVSGLVTDVSSAKQSLAATDATPFEKRQTTASS